MFYGIKYVNYYYYSYMIDYLSSSYTIFSNLPNLLLFNKEYECSKVLSIYWEATLNLFCLTLLTKLHEYEYGCPTFPTYKRYNFQI